MSTETTTTDEAKAERVLAMLSLVTRLDQTANLMLAAIEHVREAGEILGAESGPEIATKLHEFSGELARWAKEAGESDATAAEAFVGLSGIYEAFGYLAESLEAQLGGDGE